MGILAILLASFFWGTSGIFAAFIPQVSPLAIGAFATGFGGIIQFAIAWKSLNISRRRLWDNKYLCLMGGITVAMYPLAFYSSMHLAGIAVGTVVCIASAPFASIALEHLFGGKVNISIGWLMSLLFGVVGICFLIFGQHNEPVSNSHPYRLLGIGVGILGGTAYAIYTWVAKQLIEQGIPSRAAIGTLFGISSMLLLPSLLLTGDALFSQMSSLFVGGYMALIPMGLGYLLFGYGLKTVTASSATLLSLFEPVVATVLAVTIVKETLGWYGWVGIVCIAICLALQSLSQPTVIKKTPLINQIKSADTGGLH